MASFAGTDFERIWSHISRFKAMSSPPAGNNSEVALSERSDIREILRIYA